MKTSKIPTGNVPNLQQCNIIQTDIADTRPSAGFFMPSVLFYADFLETFGNKTVYLFGKQCFASVLSDEIRNKWPANGN